MQKKQANTARVALITGAARRIGADIAKVLHGAGFNVVLHYHKSAVEAEQLCQTLNAIRPQSAVKVQTDLLDSLAVPALMGEALASWGRLDVLVNNASRFYKTLCGKTTEYEWDDLFNSNLKAPFFLAQAAAKHLAQHQGTIINIADVHGERPMRDYGVYCISKAGMIMLTKVLAKELGPAVRVNAVSPGAGVMWPEGGNALSSEEQQQMVARTLLKRPAEPLAVAKAVLYLVESADFVTGQVLNVDGGRSVQI
jgi:pteridine reductase